MATEQDIADRCGVSRTTVWAVLNGKQGVKEATRERVLAAVRALNYQPPATRRSLRAQFANVTAVIVRDIHNPFFTQVSSGVREVMVANGRHMLYYGSDMELEDHAQILELFRYCHVPGYIVSAMDRGPSLDVLRSLVDEGVCVVSIGGALPDLPTPTVSIDFRRGSRLATEHLLARGHRRLAFLAGPPKWTDERTLGFVEALLRHGVPFDSSMIVTAGISIEEGRRAALQALSAPDRRPTALACFSDFIAMGAYRAAHELGLRVPDDVSIVGFDNIDITAILGPPLTTVSTFPQEIGRTAAHALLRSLRGEADAPNAQHITDVELVERESVRDV